MILRTLFGSVREKENHPNAISLSFSLFLSFSLSLSTSAASSLNEKKCKL